jgi:hypothetical protein
MDPRRLRFNEHPGLRKRVLESSWMKDTIKTPDSIAYRPDGEPKDSVDQDRWLSRKSKKLFYLDYPILLAVF